MEKCIAEKCVYRWKNWCVLKDRALCFVRECPLEDNKSQAEKLFQEMSNYNKSVERGMSNGE